jgi:hypothetical protein
MNTEWKRTIWQQFGAAIDTLENAIQACPEAVWSDRSSYHEIWYMAYHTLFFLDYYLSESPEGFAPPDPITLSELDPAGGPPDRVYTKDELLIYLEYGRQKCRSAIGALSEEEGFRQSQFRKDLTVIELYLYTLRHVQHHAAQINLLLRQRINSAPRWVSRAKLDF